MAASEEPELIGVGQTEPIETEVYRGGASGGKTFLVLLVVGLIALGFLKSGPEESESSVENQEVVGEEPDSTVATTTPRRPSTTSRPTTTTRRIAEDLGPVFHFETGWDLFVGGDGSMVRLGLDDGVTEDLGSGRTPMAVVGDYLVFAMARADSISYVPLSSLDAEPVRIPGARPIYGPQQPVVADPVDGRIWLLGGPWVS